MLKPEEHDENSTRNGFDFMKSSLSSVINADVRSKIDSLIQEVSSLKDVEKLLFCLLLPVDGAHGPHSVCNTTFGFAADEPDITSGFDLNTLGVGLFSPGGHSTLHLSNQVEQSQAYTWILSHLEEDPATCLRKDEVYEDYRTYCEKHHMKTLNTADFGKVMKRAFPNVKPRRLGQRGQSRYCYGGMRKKTEVQPPFLPDLTNEALGISVHNNLTRSTGSPASSSNGSGDTNSQRHLPSTSPLIRLLKSNGSEVESCSWVDEPSVRSSLGVRGVVIADVVHVLLEYAHQVFGVQFKSLFHLAQHLVANRYVNSRSKHAFSLIAHAANPSSSISPPPSAALAEVLQKGATKSAFDKIRNGRQNHSAVDSACSISSGPTSTVTTTPSMKSESVKFEDDSRTFTASNNVTPTNSVPRQASNPRHLSGSNSNRNFSSRQVPVLPTSDIAAAQMPTCTTPQPVGSYRNYQPRASPQTGTFGGYTAAALASPTAFQPTNHGLTHYPFNFGQTFQSASFSNTTGQNYPNGAAAGFSHHSTAMALAAAAAVAAHQKQQQSVLSNYPSNTIGFSSSLQDGSTPAYSNVPTPPSAHREKSSCVSESTASNASQSDSMYSNISSYLSPAPTGSVYAAHQQTSPYARTQQPPAPLPPGVGARSPYTPIGHPSVAVADPNQSGFKRAALPHPVEAPGAYEPSPRFHIGSQSPSKRARYLSTASGSSTNSLSTECPPLSTGSGPDSNDRYSEQVTPITHSASVAVPSPASSGSSSTGGGTHVPTTLSVGYSGSCSGRQRALGVLDQPNSISSPYYPGRYEGLEMHSPAPSSHTLRSHHTATNAGSTSSWGVPNITPSAVNNIQFESQQPTSDYMMSQARRNYGSSIPSSVPEPTNTPTVFRPPITPFTLELENEDDPENLPRLGSSPGPQIPPSSPTEFLPFYSEAATKSAQAQLRQKQYVALTPHVHTTPDSDERGTISDTSSPCLSVASRERGDVRLSAQIKTGLETSSVSSVLPQSNELSQRSVASPDSSDSNDRTLTMLESLGEVNTPPMPDGLANMPSPSESLKNNSLVRHREELQSELSTPGPAENARSPMQSCPNSSSSVQCSNSTDVSITAF